MTDIYNAIVQHDSGPTLKHDSPSSHRITSYIGNNKGHVSRLSSPAEQNAMLVLSEAEVHKIFQQVRDQTNAARELGLTNPANDLSKSMSIPMDPPYLRIGM